MIKLKKPPSLIYAEDLKDICKPPEHLGITYFSHVIVDEKNRFSSLVLQL